MWIISGKHGQSKDICGTEYRRNCRTVPLAAWPFFGPHRMSASCDDTQEETHAGQQSNCFKLTVSTCADQRAATVVELIPLKFKMTMFSRVNMIETVKAHEAL